MTERTLPRPVALGLLLLLLAPVAADAQVRRGRATQDAPPAPWAPVTVGVHGGYDDRSRGEVLGAHAFVPVIRSGMVQLVPSAEATFLVGGKDYQYGVDVVFMPSGRDGGLYAGAGIGRRRSVIDSTPANPGASTFLTYDAVVGFKAGTGFIQPVIQFRWLFLQDVVADYKPVTITFGVSLALWGRSPGG